ncbi:Macrolide export ATP-binding/permease protein MacB [Thermoflexales bacterium]|nr:Macrolide export ATP-binding/permease protein MacB [Thermoflexales bacterium]
MQIFDNVRSALRALRSNKLRSILTMLGIIIGVSAVISLLSIGQGVENFINSQFNALGTNLLFVMSKVGNSQQAQFVAQFANQTTLTQGDARALGDPRQLPDVASSTAMIRLNALARYRDAKLTTTIQGANEAYLAMRGLEVLEGRALTEDDVLGAARVAIIGQTVLEELFPPDTDPLDQFIRLNDVPFRVIGVLPERGGNQFANEDNQIIVPLTAARTYLRDIRARNGLPGVSTVLMQGVDPATNGVLKDDAINVLRDRHNINYRNEDDFQVFTQADLLQSFGAISAAITVFLSAIAGISLLVGGIGVMNIMLVTVTERTREIGLRKAIGAKRRDILFQFLVEAMTLSLVGGAIGIAIGAGGAAAVASLSNQFQPSVSPITIALATGVSALVGLFAGLYPALRAARMNPIEALRHE